MSYIPDHLTLKNGIAQSDFIQYGNNDLVITTAGVLKIAGGSGVEASVLLSVAGTDPGDNPIKYTFPDVNIAMPQQDQIISFNSDGTSQFINNGGGGGAVNAVLNTAYPTSATAGSVLVMSGGDAVSSSPTDAIIVNAGITTITGGVNITGGTSANNLSKNGSNELLVNGENNVYLNSSSGSTFIQSLGGNINLDALSGVISLACIGDINLTPTYGDVSIIKVDPKLNFNNPDYPTQQCNLSFQSANQELVIEHHTPDLASKCNIRLGVSDINIQSTFTPLNTGNINLIPQNGFVNINDYSLPNINPTADGQVLSANIDGTSSWVSSPIPAGLLRAINCNLITPTEIVDVVWSNLTPAEQLAWKGGDPTIIDPVQSATGNYWNFTKLAPSTNKIGWTIPDDLSALSFQDLQSFWVVIRFNNTTNIAVEGSLYLSIYTNPPTGLNTYRTRWNYSNPATAMNQTGYFYKLYALDTITTTTVANFGKGQEVGQTQFKNNPCNVSPELWSIALNKQVLSPSGDTTAGYTTAPIQSISLQTASNIHTFNFDVVSIGYLNKQYNLQFA